MASTVAETSGSGVIQLIGAPDASSGRTSEQKSQGMRIEFSEAEIKELKEAPTNGSKIEVSFGKAPVPSPSPVTNATSY